MRESEIEGRVNDKAVKAGFLQTKMGGKSQNGWPDRIYLYRTYAFFIEFKAPGEKPTPLQAHIHLMLIQAGFKVEVVDNVERGVDVIMKWKEYVDQELA